jgi:hypothetical protein
LAKRKARRRVARRARRAAAPKLAAKKAAGIFSGLDFRAVFDLWKLAVTNPERAIASQEGKAGYAKGVLMLCLAGALYAVIAAVLTSNFFLLALGPATFAVTVPITGLVCAAVVFVFAKLLGGRGGLREQFYLTAALFSPVFLLMACAKVFAIIPLVGFLFESAAVFVLDVYALYQATLAIRAVHKFSTLRAILSWLLPLVMLALIVLAFAMIVAAAVLAMIPAAVLVGLLA